MIPRDIVRNRALMGAAAGLVIAVGAIGWTAARALRIEPVDAAPPPRFATAEAVGPRTTPVVDVRGVVELNVFSPERTAPGRRYTLSGWDEPLLAEMRPQPLVLGTAVSTPDRTFAIAKVGDGPPTVVRTGDVIDGYTVRLIERNRVLFTSATGERFDIRSDRQD